MLARLWVCRLAPSWYFWHSAIRLRVSLLFERIISDNPDHKMTAMEQHRLEKRRMHRHSCVIAILWEGFTVEQSRLEKLRTHRRSMCHRNPLERIYCWTAQIGKAENAQTLDRICLGCKPSKSKRSYRKQQDTRKWTMRAGRADTVQAQEEHAKKQQHTQNKYHITLTASSARATLGSNRTCTNRQPE